MQNKNEDNDEWITNLANHRTNVYTPNSTSITIQKKNNVNNHWIINF